MRKLILLAILNLIIAGNLFSQSEADSVMYHKGLILLNGARTTDGFLQTAFYFDSLAKEFPDQWLVHYYSGLSYVLASQKAQVNKYKDQLLDRAQKSIDRTVSLRPDESETNILQAFFYQVRLMVDPQSRALNYSQKADACLKRAVAADSSNPRAYFLMGNNIFYTPVVFKGGPKSALPVFLKARDKYNTYTAALSFMPDWGKQENEEMIRTCSTAK